MSASEGNQASSHDNHAAGAHGDAHGHAHGHGAHAVEAPPEPKTPMWLPAVGALLFLGVGLTWALSTPAKQITDVSALPAGTAAADAGAPPSRAGQPPAGIVPGGGHAPGNAPGQPPGGARPGAHDGHGH